MSRSVFSCNPFSKARALVAPANFWGAIICLFAWTASAQLPHSRLASVFPPGGQAGSEVEVTTSGADLVEGRALLFSNPNISGKPIEGQANKFKVSISADVAPGIYDVWQVGKYGVSTSRAFVVGLRREVSESGSHGSLTSAAEVPLGVTLNARAESGASDFYRFKARRGQRILIECAAPELDSRMEPSLVLYDLDAAELGRSRSGGLIDYVATEDGDLAVKVHDLQFRGGADHVYRLLIHDGPRIDFMLPAAGQAGKAARHVVFGRNLPDARSAPKDGPLERLEVEVTPPANAVDWRGARPAGMAAPSAIGIQGFEYRVASEEAGSNPFAVGISSAPVAVEKEPNDTSAEAQKIAVPIEISGQFYRQRDQDWYEFPAKKGDSFWIEVISERLGLPTHPFALVQRVTVDDGGVEKLTDIKELYENAANLGGRRFNTYSRDASWRFDVKEDGIYRVMARDLYNVAGAQPERIYRLAIRAAAPDFQLAAMTEEPLPVKANTRPVYQWPLHVRKGGSMPVRVMAARKDGFNDPITVSVEGLPKGVIAPNVVIPAGQTTAWLVFTASPDAADWGGLIKIIGEGSIGGKPVKRMARGAGINWPIGDYRTEAVISRMTSAIALGVIGSESAAIAMTAGDGKLIEATAGGKVDLPVKVARAAGFGADLKVKVLGHGAFAKFKDATIKGAEGKVAIDLKAYKLPPGEHALFLRTQSKGKWDKKDLTATFYSTPFRIKVNPDPKK